MNASQVHQGRAAAERTRVVLLDLDGTLVDTAPDMVGALNQLRREAGHDSLPFEEVRPLVSHGTRTLVRWASRRRVERNSRHCAGVFLISTARDWRARRRSTTALGKR